MPPDVGLEDLLQGGLFDVVDVDVEVPSEFDGLIVPVLFLELLDLLHGQEPRGLPKPDAEAGDYERRYGGEQEDAAPPDGSQQQRREGRREQYADRPPALYEGVDKPPTLPVAVDLVEVGGIYRLLGVAETGKGPHDRQVGRRKPAGANP